MTAAPPVDRRTDEEIHLVTDERMLESREAAGKYKRGVGRTEAPRGGLQNMLELLVIYIRDEIARPNFGAKTDRSISRPGACGGVATAPPSQRPAPRQV